MVTQARAALCFASMVRLRRFASIVEATTAAGYLREHGIRVEIVGHHTQDVQMAVHSLSRRSGPFELVLLDPSQREDAGLVLESFDTEPVLLEADWEAAAERMALSRLDPAACAIDCPRCGSAVGLQSGACPACAEPIDALRRVVELHGPEALADAWVEEGADEDEDDAR